MQSLFGEAPPTPITHDWQIASSLDLINSRWTDHLGSGKSYDRLLEPKFRRAFLKRWQFKVADPDDRKAQLELAELRLLLRRALERYMAGRPLTAAMVHDIEVLVNRTPLRLRLDSRGGGTLIHGARTGKDWDIVIAEIAASAVRLMSEGRTVKVCANPNCTWMFVDQSKPRTRKWCNAGVCGSLTNVRRFRAALKTTTH